MTLKLKLPISYQALLKSNFLLECQLKVILFNKSQFHAVLGTRLKKPHSVQYLKPKT